MRVCTYLVLGEHSQTGKVTVRRATMRYPALASNEAVVAVELELPDGIFDAPLITVEVTKRQIAVAAEVVPPV